MSFAHTRAHTYTEYLRLLAVARGEREPDDEDEDDADFVPEDEDEGEVAADCDDTPHVKLSVPRAEIAALLADNRTTEGGSDTSNRAQCAASDQSPNGRRARSGATKTLTGAEGAQEPRAQTQTAKPATARHGRRDKKGSATESVVRVLPFSESGGLLPFPGSNAGFSRDQCIQLQNQMRDYLQLALQQYVANCCAPDKDEPKKVRARACQRECMCMRAHAHVGRRNLCCDCDLVHTYAQRARAHTQAEDIQELHAGLAEMYQHWEVSHEYNQMHAKAMQV